ncbi:hypothetical protein LR48_Vigan125s000900 [Vigna angularis]|uniref:Transposase-associated domain-containing protein n=1 Tax=Phaseolus angularis TaxID=3914 RepID=A0A0L9T683_PHAAN|nr:hypothetical protein LR48_Vigan125s000900 [Vigna angularis]
MDRSPPNRAWMYDRSQRGRGALKESFVLGVEEFITKACEQERYRRDGGLRCPCLKCDCTKILHERVVKVHLYKNGFKPNYFIWEDHGEIMPEDHVQNHDSSMAVETEDGEINQFQTMEDMVHDALRQNEFYPTKTASKAITAAIKEQCDEPWLTWGAIPKSTRDVFFERFKSQELGRSVHVDEIFQQTHIRQSTGEFVDERSRRTHEQFVAKFSQIRSETASVGVSTSSPLDPAEEERLRNRCWLEAAGGKYKGRVYGIGNVTSQDDCVDSYIQQTQASSTAQPQNSEEILNLKSQLQEYGQQLQNLKGFIGVLLPFLPPSAAAAAQQYLNLQNPQVQNDVPNIVQPEQQPPEQQPPEQQPPHQQPPDEQPQDGNDYMHY